MLLHNLMIDMRCPNGFLRAAEWCRNDTPELIAIDRIDKVISPKGLDHEATLVENILNCPVYVPCQLSASVDSVAAQIGGSRRRP